MKNESLNEVARREVAVRLMKKLEAAGYGGLSVHVSRVDLCEPSLVMMGILDAAVRVRVVCRVEQYGRMGPERQLWCEVELQDRENLLHGLRLSELTAGLYSSKQAELA